MRMKHSAFVLLQTGLRDASARPFINLHFCGSIVLRPPLPPYGNTRRRSPGSDAAHPGRPLALAVGGKTHLCRGETQPTGSKKNSRKKISATWAEEASVQREAFWWNIACWQYKKEEAVRFERLCTEALLYKRIPVAQQLTLADFIARIYYGLCWNPQRTDQKSGVGWQGSGRLYWTRARVRYSCEWSPYVGGYLCKLLNLHWLHDVN